MKKIISVISIFVLLLIFTTPSFAGRTLGGHNKYHKYTERTGTPGHYRYSGDSGYRRNVCETIAYGKAFFNKDHKIGIVGVEKDSCGNILINMDPQKLPNNYKICWQSECIEAIEKFENKQNNQNEPTEQTEQTEQIIMPDVKPEDKFSTNGTKNYPIGYTLDQAKNNKAFNQTMEAEDVNTCVFIGLVKQPGLNFLFENSKLAMIEVLDPQFSTLSGISVGDSLEKLKATYPNMTTEKGEDGGMYYDVSAKDKQIADRGIRFFVDNNKVQLIRAGLKPAIYYYEGCL